MDRISEKKCTEIHDQAKSNDYWHDINAYRREVALSLLQTAKEKDMSLYVALKAIYSNATIKNWKKADYKLGRDTMLTLCVLQKLSITEANKFLVEKMRSYPIHTRNPEEAVYYFVMNNSATILHTLHHERLIQNQNFLKKLNEKKGGYSGGRVSYKKERTAYHSNKDGKPTKFPVFVVDEEKILKYIYDFLSCTSEQRDEAIARIMLAMYAENLAEYSKNRYIVSARIVTSEASAHTSYFMRSIDECDCEQQFLSFLDENSESLGMARMSVYREMKDIIYEQAYIDDENRFQFYQKMMAFAKKYKFLLCFKYTNSPNPNTSIHQSDIPYLESVEVITHSDCLLTKEQIKNLIELYDDLNDHQGDNTTDAEILRYIDGLFGFAIANCYLGICCEENAIRANGIHVPISTSYRALNTVIHHLLGLEWKNHQYHHHAVYHANTFLSVIRATINECGLSIHNKAVSAKKNVIKKPLISLSRSLVLLQKLKELIYVYISCDGKSVIYPEDCLDIIALCDEQMHALGFAPLDRDFYPDRIILERLNCECENQRIDARVLWRDIQEDLTSFTDEVYSHEHTIETLQITNQTKGDRRSPLNNGAMIRSANFVYRIEKEISRGSSSIIYLADMSPISTPEQLQLVLVKEAYPLEAGELRSDKQIHVSIPKAKEKHFKHAQSLLKKEFDLYTTLQRNEGSLLRRQYQASEREYCAAQQPLDFLMETVELFNSEETGTTCLVIKTFRGRTLDAYSEQLKKASFESILDIFKKIVIAVDHLHKRNVLHLDLKPDNIFITDTNSVKLIDLNAACLIEDSPCFTSVSQFSPPEAMLARTPDKTADTYSLTAILNWMLLQNGSLLLDDGRSVTTPVNLFSQLIPCLQTIPYQDVELMNKIVHYGLNQQIERRFANATIMLNEMERLSTTPHKIESNSRHESVVRIISSLMLYRANGSADHYTESLMSLFTQLVNEKTRFSVDETAAFISTIDTQYLFKGRPDIAIWGYDIVDQLHTLYPEAFPLRNDDLMHLVGRLYNCATQTASNKAKEYERRLFQVPVDSVLQQIDAANKLLNMYEEDFRFQEAFSEGVELIQQLEQLRQPLKQSRGILSRLAADSQSAYQKINEELSKVLSKNAQQLAYQGQYSEAKERFEEALNTPTTEGNRSLTISFAFHAAVAHAVVSRKELDDPRLVQWAKELYILDDVPDLMQDGWYKPIEQKIQFESNKDSQHNILGFMKLLWAVQNRALNSPNEKYRKTSISSQWFKKLSSKVIASIRNMKMQHLAALTAQYGFFLARSMNLSNEAISFEYELRELSIPNGVAGIIVAAAKAVCAPKSIPWQESELYTLLKHYIETADIIDEDQRESYQAIKQYFEKTIESKKGTISLIRYLYA